MSLVNAQRVLRLGMATGVLFYLVGRSFLRWLGIAFAADKVRQPPSDSVGDQGDRGTAE
jgi:hypothetical protein